MNIYIMTDIEGVAGVLDFDNWAMPDGRYYEDGKLLLTGELNAAIEGFCAAGADEIFVCDGHGHGAINITKLHKRALYSRGWVGPRPFGMLDRKFDCMAVIGQHAKSRTPYSHLTHTGSTSVFSLSINGIEVGEYGEQAFISSEIGFPVIFASGEKAFCKEVEELTPWVHTVAVKEGIMPGSGDECTAEQYEKRNLGAVHLSPERARELIREESERALRDFINNREKFKLLKLDPPYTLDIKYRAQNGNPPCAVHGESNTSLISLMNGENRKRVE